MAQHQVQFQHIFTITMKHPPPNVRLNMKLKIKKGEVCKERVPFGVQTELTEKRMTLEERVVGAEASQVQCKSC